MGRIISSTRQTRFAPSGPKSVSSHMADLRELEQAIAELQDLVAAQAKEIAALKEGT